MYQKFWNQFLTEAAEPTFNLGDEKPTKPDAAPKRSYPSP